MLTLAVCACSSAPVVVTPPKPEPLDLLCDADAAAMCSGDCPPLAKLVTDADGGASFDAILALQPADSLARQVCIAKLRACQACLRRGREAGVIR